MILSDVTYDINHLVWCDEKHNNNIIRILNFVIFLLVLLEATNVDSLCKAFDEWIVKTWRNIIALNIMTSVAM